MKKIAVFFGGCSTEHDISILTGLQAMSVIDTTQYEPFPVYISSNGKFWVGDDLVYANTYKNFELTKKKLKEVFLSSTRYERPQLRSVSGLFKKNFVFDAALLAFHGEYGEGGGIQGVMETANIPYTGTRTLASSIFMNKAIAKKVLKDVDIPVLDDFIFKKPKDMSILEKQIKETKVKYPVCAKPNNLGSSIGVHKAKNNKDLLIALLDIFQMDEEVLVEPFIENLVEYNVAVTKSFDGVTVISAIEEPLRGDDVLSFEDKYIKGGKSGKGKMNANVKIVLAEDRVHSTRRFNPKLTPKQEKIIKESAIKAFDLLGGTGAPRVDFYGNGKTGEIWLNEFNTIPGLMGYYLWEASKYQKTFTELMSAQIEEAILENQNKNKMLSDTATAKSKIF